MYNGGLFSGNDLVDNPTMRVPVCICLDVSGSMDGDPIQELNRGVQLFYDAIRDDDMALYSAEVSVVTFGDQDAQCVANFACLTQPIDPPTFSASGGTPMGEGVNLALDLLESRKELYKKNGIDYYQPWLVLMSDGLPNGSVSELNRAIQRTTQLVNDRKLTIFPIGIGPDADMDTLAKFSPRRSPLRLKGLNFPQFFSWLSKSVSQVSQSMPGDEIKLDVEGLKGWATLD